MWHGWGGAGWGGMWLGWLFWLIILIIIIWVVLRVLSSNQIRRGDGGSGESALDILKKRYARGEISKEQFDKMKKDLES
ncbi:MAG: SHOCT domain-containing protein [Calditrichia bacterium]